MNTNTIESVHDPARASALMDSRRQQILRMLSEPASAADLARRLGLPRQKVNYHVRKLAAAGFLRKAGTRRKRNLTEQRWRATSAAYLLSPDVVAGLAPRPESVADRGSAEYLLALSSRLQLEVSRALDEAGRQGERLPTLSINADVGFQSPNQRAEFANALRSAVAGVVARYSSPPEDTGSRPYRLVIGCHPTPPPAEQEPPDDR